MKFLRIFFLSCFLLLTLIVQGKQQEKPNIIFILADDLGFMDVNYFANKLTETETDSMFYETPNIDALAKQGVSFSQAYANQLCSPTRASILTGKYASRLGFTTATPNTKTYYSAALDVPEGFHPLDAVNHHDKLQVESPFLNATCMTGIPAGTKLDAGKDEITIAEALEGYNSAFIGKWHVGGHGAKGYTPSDQGFQELSWLDAGGSPYYNWRKKWNRDSVFFKTMPQDKLYMSAIKNDNEQKYLTDELTKQAVNYITEQKNANKPFFLYFCHFAVHSPWQGHKDYNNHFKNKTTLGWNGHNHIQYASMIKALDNSVGTIMQSLKDNEIAENTIIIFMSDNGGLVQIKDFIITKNTPLKGGKANVTEGGVRVPLIISDPRKQNTKKWCNTMVNCTDIFPTIIELAGQNTANLPEIDGISAAPLLQGNKKTIKKFENKAIYWHYPFNVKVVNPDDGYPLTPHSAMRKGDYKIIVDWAGNIGLYNIAKDISEENNLSESNPELRDKMYKELVSWLGENVETRYFPRINTDYNVENDPRIYKYKELTRTTIKELISK